MRLEEQVECMIPTKDDILGYVVSHYQLTEGRKLRLIKDHFKKSKDMSIEKALEEALAHARAYLDDAYAEHDDAGIYQVVVAEFYGLDDEGCDLVGEEIFACRYQIEHKTVVTLL